MLRSGQLQPAQAQGCELLYGTVKHVLVEPPRVLWAVYFLGEALINVLHLSGRRASHALMPTVVFSRAIRRVNENGFGVRLETISRLRLCVLLQNGDHLRIHGGMLWLPVNQTFQHRHVLSTLMVGCALTHLAHTLRSLFHLAR